MLRIYANLLGTWTDITDNGTVADHQDPITYFKENLKFTDDSTVAECFKFGYIHIQYGNKDYRIHPSMLQIVTE